MNESFEGEKLLLVKIEKARIELEFCRLEASFDELSYSHEIVELNRKMQETIDEFNNKFEAVCLEFLIQRESELRDSYEYALKKCENHESRKIDFLGLYKALLNYKLQKTKSDLRIFLEKNCLSSDMAKSE